MICQATIAAHGFDAWDECADWCEEHAETTVPLALVQGKRAAHVWLCAEHYAEFIRAMETA